MGGAGTALARLEGPVVLVSVSIVVVVVVVVVGLGIVAVAMAVVVKWGLHGSIVAVAVGVICKAGFCAHWLSILDCGDSTGTGGTSAGLARKNAIDRLAAALTTG